MTLQSLSSLLYLSEMTGTRSMNAEKNMPVTATNTAKTERNAIERRIMGSDTDTQ